MPKVMYEIKRDPDSRTEFSDRTGQHIYIGDVLQTRLGNYAMKSGGPSKRRVVRYGQHIKLVAADADETPHGGLELTKQIAGNSVIVEKEFYR